ncbi:MAG TPA: oligosaccharide flippase family protein [Steroidobacteraceae bacterium]|nr:oligosaccharide flippase family protein [Steroidobacteraceae bacterium]
MGERARHGSVWMVAATGAAKALGLGTQLVLAGLMPRGEFGIYAIAISLSVLLSVMRDGGLPAVLVQKGRRFDLYAGSVFWLMLVINTATGVVLAAAARPAASFYHQPELAAVIDLFALSLPLGVPASLLTLRLSSAMRFTEVSLVQVVSAVVRNVLLLVFAWHGWGARSFVLPVLITNLSDALLLWCLTRYSPWSRPPRPHRWGKLLRSGRWVLLGTFAFALGNNGAYFILAKILPNEVLAGYFFAFQLVMLLGVLVVSNSYQVLFAAFSRISGEPPRLRVAVFNALGAVALVGSVASMALAAVFQPFEQLVWHGKWSTAGSAIMVLAVVWPTTTVVSVMHAVQAAAGRFRLWGCMAFLTAVLSIVGSVLGAWAGRSAFAAAIGYGVGTLLGMQVNASYSLPLVGLASRTAMLRAARPWSAALLAAAVSLGFARLAGDARAGLLVAALSFALLVYAALRLVARDSLELVVSSLRSTLVSARLLPR